MATERDNILQHFNLEPIHDTDILYTVLHGVEEKLTDAERLTRWMAVIPENIIKLVNLALEQQRPFLPPDVTPEMMATPNEVLPSLNQMEILYYCLDVAIQTEDYTIAAAIAYVVDRATYRFGFSRALLKVVDVIRAESPDTPVAPQVIIRKARIMKDDGDLHGAIRVLDAVISRKSKWNYKTEDQYTNVKAVCVQVKGQILHNLGLWKEAIEALVESVESFNVLHDDKGTSSSLGLLTRCLNKLSMQDFMQVKQKFPQHFRSNHPCYEAYVQGVQAVRYIEDLGKTLYLYKHQLVAEESLLMFAVQQPSVQEEYQWFRKILQEMTSCLAGHQTVDFLNSAETFFEFVRAVFMISITLWFSPNEQDKALSRYLEQLSVELYRHLCAQSQGELVINVKHTSNSVKLMNTALNLLGLPPLKSSNSDHQSKSMHDGVEQSSNSDHQSNKSTHDGVEQSSNSDHQSNKSTHDDVEQSSNSDHQSNKSTHDGVEQSSNSDHQSNKSTHDGVEQSSNSDHQSNKSTHDGVEQSSNSDHQSNKSTHDDVEQSSNSDHQSNMPVRTSYDSAITNSGHKIASKNNQNHRPLAELDDLSNPTKSEQSSSSDHQFDVLQHPHGRTATYSGDEMTSNSDQNQSATFPVESSKSKHRNQSATFPVESSKSKHVKQSVRKSVEKFVGLSVTHEEMLSSTHTSIGQTDELHAVDVADAVDVSVVVDVGKAVDVSVAVDVGKAVDVGEAVDVGKVLEVVSISVTEISAVSKSLIGDCSPMLDLSKMSRSNEDSNDSSSHSQLIGEDNSANISSVADLSISSKTRNTTHSSSETENSTSSGSGKSSSLVDLNATTQSSFNTTESNEKSGSSDSSGLSPLVDLTCSTVDSSGLSPLVDLTCSTVDSSGLSPLVDLTLSTVDSDSLESLMLGEGVHSDDLAEYFMKWRPSV